MWLKVGKMRLDQREAVLKLLVGHEKLKRVAGVWTIVVRFPTAILRRCSDCRAIVLINIPADKWQCDCGIISEVKDGG